MPEIGNWVIANSKLIETITLTNTIDNWRYSRIRVIGNVFDLITEPLKKNYNYCLLVFVEKITKIENFQN